MKGYYAIYSHYKNEWLTTGNWWMSDLPHDTITMATDMELSRWWTSDADEKMTLNKKDFKEVMIKTGNTKSPFNIRVWDSLVDAEHYLLNGPISKNHPEDFFTIRKIYF